MTLQIISLPYLCSPTSYFPCFNMLEDKEWNDKYLFTTKYISNLRLDWLL